MNKKQWIIKLWERKKLVHPTHREIAADPRVDSFKSYVSKVIGEYKATKSKGR